MKNFRTKWLVWTSVWLALNAGQVAEVYAQSGCGCDGEDYAEVTVSISGIAYLTVSTGVETVTLTVDHPTRTLRMKADGDRITGQGFFDEFQNCCDTASVSVWACGYKFAGSSKEGSFFEDWKAGDCPPEGPPPDLDGPVAMSTAAYPLKDIGRGNGGGGGGGGGGGTAIFPNMNDVGGSGYSNGQASYTLITPGSSSVTLQPQSFYVRSHIPLGYSVDPDDGEYRVMGRLQLAYPMDASSLSLNHFKVNSLDFDETDPANPLKPVYWNSGTTDPRVLLSPEGALRVATTVDGVKVESFSRSDYNETSGQIEVSAQPVSTYAFDRAATGKVTVSKWLRTAATGAPTEVEEYEIAGGQFIEIANGIRTETEVADDLAAVTLTGNAAIDEPAILGASRFVMRSVYEVTGSGNLLISRTIEEFGYLPEREWEVDATPRTMGPDMVNIKEVRKSLHHDFNGNGTVDSEEPFESWVYYGEQGELTAENYGLLGSLKYHHPFDGNWRLYGYGLGSYGPSTVTYGPWLNTAPPNLSLVGIVEAATVPPGVGFPVVVTVQERGMTTGTDTQVTREYYAEEAALSSWSSISSSDFEVKEGRSQTHRESFGGTWSPGSENAWSEFTEGGAVQPHRLEVTTYGTKDIYGPFWYQDYSSHQLKVSPGHSRQEIEVYGDQGLLVRETRILPADATGMITIGQFETATRETFAYDDLNRLVEEKRDGRVTATYQYLGDRSWVVTDQEGVATAYEADARGRLVSSTVMAGGGVGAVVTTHDHEGLVTTTKVNGVVVMREERDLYGRRIEREDQTGALATWTYTDNGRTITEAGAGGETTVSSYHRDGRISAVTGTGVVSRHFEHQVLIETILHPLFGFPVDVVRFKETERSGGPSSPRARVTVSDENGNVIEIHTPNAVTGALDVVEVSDPSQLRFDGVRYGRVKLADDSLEIAGRASYPGYSGSQRTPGGTMGMHTLAGRVTGWGFGGLPAGATRLMESHTYYEKIGGMWWETTLMRRGLEDAGSTVESVTRVRLWEGDGQQTVSLSEEGESVTTTTDFNPSTLEATVTAVSSRSAVPVITKRINGYVQWVQGRHSDEPEHRATFAYDGFGRVIEQRDHRGAVTKTVYNALGQVERTVDTLGRATLYSYIAPGTPGAGRVGTITKPDGTTSIYTYTLRGEIAGVGGTSEYPQSFTYNLFGDRETLTTTNAAGNSVTRWEYNAAGLVSAKYYGWQSGDTPSTPGTMNYVYDPFGRLLEKAVAGGKTTGYTYTIFDEVETIDYGGDGPADVILTRNAAGNIIQAEESYEDAGGGALGAGTTSYSYTAGRLDGVAYSSGHSYLPDVKLDYKSPDAEGRPAGYQAIQGTTPHLDVTYGYDATGRFGSVSSAHGTATYAYHAGSGIVSGYTVSSGGTVLAQTRPVDFQGRISSVTTKNGAGQTLAAVGYSHDALDRRTQARREDGTYWSYGYNDRGEVTSGDRHLADGPVISGLGRSYIYDAMGNRTLAAFGTPGDGTMSAITYQVNASNQYSGVVTSDRAWIVGKAPVAQPVAVNGELADRQGEWFARELEIENYASPVKQTVSVEAGVGGALIEEGEVYLPKEEVAPVYDAAGNLTEDSRWLYEWDSENRLRKMTPTAAAIGALLPNRVIEFVYDWQGKRIAKKVTEGTTIVHKRYLYEEWNVVAEWTLHGSSPTLATPQTYLWGLDLAGQWTGNVAQLQRGGGVGGLIAVEVRKIGDATSLGNLYASYDGNGNILAWSAADGTVKGSQDYDAFGNVVLKHTDAVGSLAPGQGEVTYGFSTKPEEVDSGFLYYGYRYYDPVTGRWPSRDPIEEEGGANLFGFIGNSPIDNSDYLGLSAYIGSGPFYRHWLWGNGTDYEVSYYKYAPDWSALEFSDYVDAQKKICSKNVGETIEVNQIKNYDTNDAPGRVNVRLKGKYTKHGDSCWKFEGDMTIDDDVYDFDKQDYGVRDGGDSWFYLKENAVRVGRIPKGTSYTVKFKGKGNRDAYGKCR